MNDLGGNAYTYSIRAIAHDIKGKKAHRTTEQTACRTSQFVVDKLRNQFKDLDSLPI
jgi:hypothetical protein